MERLSEEVKEGDGDSLDTSGSDNSLATTDMDPWGKEKERPAKNDLVAHVSRKRGVQSRGAVLERGAHYSARQEHCWRVCVETLCATLVQRKGKSLVTFNYCIILWFYDYLAWISRFILILSKARPFTIKVNGTIPRLHWTANAIMCFTWETVVKCSHT